jgi:hypothetical protein
MRKEGRLEPSSSEGVETEVDKLISMLTSLSEIIPTDSFCDNFG